jgi:hypothetical protein
MDSLFVYLENYIKAIPMPKDGRDGKDGVNGTEGKQGPAGRDGADVVALLGIAITGIDAFQWRSDDAGQIHGTDGKDGARPAGKDGRDGFSLEDFF